MDILQAIRTTVWREISQQTMGRYAPWYEGEGSTRGMNEPCAFLNEIRGILMLLWTDGNYIDAEEDEVKFTDEKLDGRFDCTELEILMPGTEIDYAGMQMFQNIKFTGLCLETYIEKTPLILGLADSSKTHYNAIGTYWPRS